MITLTNDFHNTRREVRAKAGDTISPARIKAIGDSLCGFSGCLCSCVLGTRGPQPDNGGLVIETYLQDDGQIVGRVIQTGDLDEADLDEADQTYMAV